MINNQEDDEFVAVRVQDPRIQNEGSWNSYVDYKIFLHTNSKAFTAKTSCVRRRYSEFSWLKKKLQKNAGLVPVPDLPGKSFFSFSNEDFLEVRRKGLQSFLDKVVHMTVCLSDSQLHLFLQTQLPIGHIQDCVQGHTPYSVTDAILTYASSNQGFAQAQEDDAVKEPSLTVSYESMDSPVPHQPCLQTKDGPDLQLVPSPDPDPAEGLQAEDKPPVRVLQKNNQLEAVVEASFFLGDHPESETQQVETQVEVHCREEDKEEETLHQQEATAEIDLKESTSPEDSTGSQEDGVDEVRSEELLLETNGLDGDAEDVKSCDGPETGLETRPETGLETRPETGPESGEESAEIDLKDCVSPEDGAGSQEDGVDEVRSEDLLLETNGLDRVGRSEGDAEDVKSCDGPETRLETRPETGPETRPESGPESGPQSTKETAEIQEVVRDEAPNGDEEPDQTEPEREADLVGTKDESDDDGESSNESIVKVSDEESVCDEAELSMRALNGFVEASDEEEASSRTLLDLHLNGCPVAVQEEEELHTSETSDWTKSVDLNSTGAAGDLTENSDFSVIETSCSPGGGGAQSLI